VSDGLSLPAAKASLDDIGFGFNDVTANVLLAVCRNLGWIQLPVPHKAGRPLGEEAVVYYDPRSRAFSIEYPYRADEG
jgi:hypothetical protein